MACVSRPPSSLYSDPAYSASKICYTGFDTRAAPFGLAFFREAERLWKAERSSHTVTILAAINVLSLAAAYIGKDDFSRDLILNARVMAEQMGLFGPLHSSLETTSFSEWSEARLRATAHVAWGTYCWLT